MNTFNINSIIGRYGLNTEALAPVLFPGIKYPKMALDRVIKGEGELNINQVLALANYIGVLVQDLFSVDTWKASWAGSFIVTKGQYRAVVNYNNTYITLYKNDRVIGQCISNAQSLTVQEFISLLDNTIKNYENGTN